MELSIKAFELQTCKFENTSPFMYSGVVNYIKQRIEISDEELEEGLKYSVFKKYAKGEYILRIGECCRFIGFINKGVIVTATVDDAGKVSAFDFKR